LKSSSCTPAGRSGRAATPPLGRSPRANSSRARTRWSRTGFRVAGDFLALDPLKQPSGKIVHAWAVEAELDPAAVVSNTFQLEWPPRSGKTIEIPEVDCAGWFDIKTARAKLHHGQVPFLDALKRRLAPRSRGRGER
jgi:predicted NUDIX family NTP pyrophosphohydrolase